MAWSCSHFLNGREKLGRLLVANWVSLKLVNHHSHPPPTFTSLLDMSNGGRRSAFKWLSFSLVQEIREFVNRGGVGRLFLWLPGLLGNFISGMRWYWLVVNGCTMFHQDIWNSIVSLTKSSHQFDAANLNWSEAKAQFLLELSLAKISSSLLANTN